WNEPLVIAQVSFMPREQVVRHTLLLGDAAGLIAPLCGNGMSMALTGSLLAVGRMTSFLEGRSDRSSMEYGYARAWQDTFSRRLTAGRLIQGLFRHPWATNLAVRGLKYAPGAVSRIIRQTHG